MGGKRERVRESRIGFPVPKVKWHDSRVSYSICAAISLYCSYTVPSNHQILGRWREICPHNNIQDFWTTIFFFQKCCGAGSAFMRLRLSWAGSAFMRLRRSRISVYKVASEPDQHFWGCVTARSAFMRLCPSRISVYEVALEPDQGLWGCVGAGSVFMRLRQSRISIYEVALKTDYLVQQNVSLKG